MDFMGSAVASDRILGYNWENDALPFPIGLGLDAVIKLGPMPTKFRYRRAILGDNGRGLCEIT